MRVPPMSDRIKEAPAQALRGVFAGIGQLLLITDKLRNKTPADHHVPSARVPEPAESVAEAGGVTVVQEPAAASAAGVAEAAGAGAAVEAEVTEVPRTRKPAERKSAERKPAQPKASQEKAAQPKASQEKAAAPPTAEPKAAGQKAAEPKAAPRPPAQRTPKTPAEKATETRDLDRTGNVRLIPDTGGAARAASARADAKIPAAQAASEPPPAVGEPPVAAGAEEASGTVAAAGAREGTGTTVEAGASEAPLPNYDELSLASLRARLRNLDIGQVRELAEYEKAHAARADVIAMFERRIAKLEIGD
jgi:hypothetical protein